MPVHHTEATFCTWISYRQYFSLKIHTGMVCFSIMLYQNDIDKTTSCTVLAIKVDRCCNAQEYIILLYKHLALKVVDSSFTGHAAIGSDCTLHPFFSFFFWRYILVSLLRIIPALLNLHFQKWVKLITSFSYMALKLKMTVNGGMERMCIEVVIAHLRYDRRICLEEATENSTDCRAVTSLITSASRDVWCFWTTCVTDALEAFVTGVAYFWSYEGLVSV
jgi:hypothetical protein